MRSNKLIVGQKIKQYRLKAKLTQTELANRLGYKNSSSITFIEQGKADIPLEVLNKIALALNVSPSVFVEWRNTNDYSEYCNYLPYLAKADSKILFGVRKLLDMPENDIIQKV